MMLNCNLSDSKFVVFSPAGDLHHGWLHKQLNASEAQTEKNVKKLQSATVELFPCTHLWHVLLTTLVKVTFFIHPNSIRGEGGELQLVHHYRQQEKPCRLPISPNPF